MYEARDVAKQPARHRTAPHNRVPYLRCHCAQGGNKPLTRGILKKSKYLQSYSLIFGMVPRWKKGSCN